MTMGVFERGSVTAFLCGKRIDSMVEYCVYKRARSGRSPASNNDRDGMMTDQKDKHKTINKLLKVYYLIVKRVDLMYTVLRLT